MKTLLDLLQLADSALPIGAGSHSFGFETLAEEGCVSEETVESFFRDYLSEAGVLDASFVRRAWRGEDAKALSDEYCARRPARESREAALKIGRRFSELGNALLNDAILPHGAPHPIAFGMLGAHLGIPENEIVTAYLRQSIAGLISVSQRLLPIGQVAASRMMWDLKPSICAAAAASEEREVGCFTPLPELASMRHGSLETRLFIS